MPIFITLHKNELHILPNNHLFSYLPIYLYKTYFLERMGYVGETRYPSTLAKFDILIILFSKLLENFQKLFLPNQNFFVKDNNEYLGNISLVEMIFFSRLIT
jgi:hypothetical protein